MRVRELMTRKVVSCRLGDSVNTAAKAMWDGDCGSIPVLNADGVVMGMITDRDICMACFTKDRAPDSVAVQDAMSHQLFSCRPDHAVVDAERVMRANQVRRLPVVDDQGRLVGILSLADIAREAERERQEAHRDVQSTEVVEVLVGICQDHHAGQRTH